jgi:hypothetical protein
MLTPQDNPSTPDACLALSANEHEIDSVPVTILVITRFDGVFDTRGVEQAFTKELSVRLAQAESRCEDSGLVAAPYV